MTISTAFNTEVRVGFQVFIDGENVEVNRFLTLLSLFLEVAIPALVALQMVSVILLAILDGIQDGLNLISAFWGPIANDILLIYWGLRLSILLVGVLKDEISRGTDSNRSGHVSGHSLVRE